jgi:hypothetical protein
MGEENLLFSRPSHAPRPPRPHHQPSYSRHRHDADQTLTYLVPPPPPTQFSLLDEPFIALFEETRSILASSDFAGVLEVCLDRATEVLFEGLEKNVFGRDAAAHVAGGGDGAVGVEVERIRLAGLLPGLARWSQLALNGLPNELVDVRFIFSICLPFLSVLTAALVENLELAGGVVYFGDCVWEVRGEVSVMIYISSIEMYMSYPYTILLNYCISDSRAAGCDFVILMNELA